MPSQIPANADNTDDSVETIADALSRLRGRRRGPHSDRHRFTAHSDDHAPHYRGERLGRSGARGAHGLGGSPAIVRMIDALAQSPDPLSVSSIAEAVGVDQPRASRLVQQGVERELLAREADPDDARRTRIALTEAGVRFAQGVRTDRRESLNTALADFTSPERAELARLLVKLADAWPR